MRSLLPTRAFPRRLLYEVLHIWASAQGLSTFNIGFAPVDAAIRAHPAFGLEPHQIQLYAEIARFAGIVPAQNENGPRVFEVGMGCGGGLDYLRFAIAGADVSGVDNTRAAVLSSRRKGLKAHFGSADRLPVADGAFDYVLCIDSFSLFTRETFIAEAFRVLRPGGRLVIGDYLMLPSDAIRHDLLELAARTQCTIERYADATAGVLRAIEEDHSRKKGIIRALPKRLRGRLAETLSMRGSHRYAHWQRGAACYYMALLRRSEGSKRDAQ